jgi:nucleoside-diphosphate-sugar epimerase
MAWSRSVRGSVTAARKRTRLVSVACATAASTSTSPTTLLIFGAGFIGEHVAKRAAARGFSILGTTRRVGDRELELAQRHIRPLIFDGSRPLSDDLIDRHLASVTHVLSTVPPLEGVDPVLAHHARTLQRARMPALRWLGHLSTTAVYGAQTDVDERSEPAPATVVENLRFLIEQEWAALAGADAAAQVPVHIFRPASVYGPGRGPQQVLRTGDAVAIEKPGHSTSRIHVEDLAAAIVASMEQAMEMPPATAAIAAAAPSGGASGDAKASAPAAVHSYVLADSEPAPPSEVLRYAASIYGRPPPPSISFEKVEKRLSAAQRAFWSANMRVASAGTLARLGVELRYPSYREGLRATVAVEGPLPPIIETSAAKAAAPPLARPPIETAATTKAAAPLARAAAPVAAPANVPVTASVTAAMSPAPPAVAPPVAPPAPPARASRTTKAAGAAGAAGAARKGKGPSSFAEVVEAMHAEGWTYV